jgi:hypothetical protein
LRIAGSATPKDDGPVPGGWISKSRF